MISHVISAWWAMGSVHDSHVISAWKLRDQCMISHVNSASSATWSFHVQARDQCMNIHVISVWSASWSVHDQPRDQCMISQVMSAWSRKWSVLDQAGDQCMISHIVFWLFLSFFLLIWQFMNPNELSKCFVPTGKNKRNFGCLDRWVFYSGFTFYPWIRLYNRIFEFSVCLCYLK